MFAFQLALSLVACGGGTPEAPKPEPAPDAAPEAEPAAEPEAEPAAGEGEMEPIEVELETNQMTCFGNADCTVVDLDCCCGKTLVAVNKGSAEAVTKANKRDAAACESVECETEECEKPEAVCEQAKCKLKE